MVKNKQLKNQSLNLKDGSIANKENQNILMSSYKVKVRFSQQAPTQKVQSSKYLRDKFLFIKDQKGVKLLTIQ